MTARRRGDAITWRGCKLDPAWFASHEAYLISDSIGLHNTMRVVASKAPLQPKAMRFAIKLSLNHHNVLLSDDSLEL